MDTAEIRRSLSSRRGQPSRLQRRAPAPASIQISPVTEWNVAIPLLSPLVQSPDNLSSEINKSCSSRDEGSPAAAENPVAAGVMKNWQHPAAPFCYEPAALLPFVCTGSF